MSLVVGFFEAVFFRGFVQNCLVASFGTVRGVGGAALLYGLYHVGYGMGGADIVFLVGLGVVYAVVFAQAQNVIAVWPLLTPLGSLGPASAASRGFRGAAAGRAHADGCRFGAAGPDQPGPQRPEERGVQHPHPAVGGHVHQRQPLQQVDLAVAQVADELR
jgi:CAAX prenyl protease-like protein